MELWHSWAEAQVGVLRARQRGDDEHDYAKVQWMHSRVEPRRLVYELDEHHVMSDSAVSTEEQEQLRLQMQRAYGAAIAEYELESAG